MQLTRSSLLALAALTLGASVQAAIAQSYPSNVIRIVIGWRIVVENKPGAMSSVSAPEVLKQPADGHTILATGLPSVVGPALLSNASFRLDTDFAPVIKLMTANHVLVVNP